MVEKKAKQQKLSIDFQKWARLFDAGMKKIALIIKGMKFANQFVRSMDISIEFFSYFL